MKIPFSPPDITEAEINSIIDTLKSGWITTGPKTKNFEKKIAEYCGTDKAVCLNSATACLESILRILGIGPGDEVITSAYTYTATASPVCHLGASLVLVDTGAGSFEMDYERLADAITEKTKAIIAVDLAGIMCNYDKIYKAVNDRKYLFEPSNSNSIQEALGRPAVVADGAHAFGAEQRGRKCGSVADFTSFSFHAVKNLTTAEGGALTWKPLEGIDDEDLYKEFMLMSLHGQSKDALAKTDAGSWEYDIVYPAYKCNMTDIQAGIGLAQMERYPDILERRRQIIEAYNAALIPLGVDVLNHYADDRASSGHLYLTRIPGYDEQKRNKLIVRLAQRGVATNVHYKPLPILTAYRNLGFKIADYYNAFRQYENEITLPLHTNMTDEMVEYVIEHTMEMIQCD